ncbi:MAG: oxidoreductase, partial [Methanoregula sp.]|nr:oxidoreductase [Methanoregula sp.]
MNSKNLAIIVIAVIILIVAVFFLFGGQGSRSISSTGGPIALPGVEVRAYQGNDLSSINDFRENSIRGPQYVNTSDYRLTVTGLTNKTDV